jgi:regulator of sigma E protease
LDLNNIGAIALVVIGLGFVIFIHELGHFLVAKWNGVKVEKFSIGFGPPLLKWRRGETEYLLSALPLGGYVKMLGENPGEDASAAGDDPRAYPNKPVSSRMAIISAGVIMNFIFGWLCASYVYLRGTLEIPPIIGGVVAGSPAYEAGLRAGDRVIALENRRDITYDDIRRASIFSAAGQVLHLQIQRPGKADPITIGLEPRTHKREETPMIGITPASALSIGEPPSAGPLKDLLKPGDKIVALTPQGGVKIDIADQSDLESVLCRYRSVPLSADIERPDPKNPERVAERLSINLPTVPMFDLGLRLTPGPIAAIRPGSIAESAGLRVGDRITQVDDAADFDPVRLPDLAYDAALENRALILQIERPGAGEARETFQISLKPDDSPIWLEPTVEREHLEIPGLGCAITIIPQIQSVVPGSPAAQAGVQPGQTIQSVTMICLGPKGVAERTVTLEDFHTTWAFIRDWIQRRPHQTIKLALSSSSSVTDLVPAPVADWLNPSRDLSFEILTRTLPPQPFQAALVRGWRDSIDVVGSLFATIRGFFQNRLGTGSIGGPVRIAGEAYRFAQRGLDSFIPFLGILSINLAVINFLPIPPLDGGQLVFLIAEKLRGKPLPESPVIVATLAGLTMLLLLIVFTFFNDIRNTF